MIRFENDYAEGAHPKILEMLTKTNAEQTPGYGMDAYCERAREIIRGLCKNERAGVHFLVGGTQANAAVISAGLRPYQGVVSPDTGHIAVHETGAVEAYGHKVLTIPSLNGKITAGQVEEMCRAHLADNSREHTVQPGMVYISQATELGTLYSREELTALSSVCRRYGLYLFVDGARLGYAVADRGCGLGFADIAALCDVFYIGGTKLGALFGEAVVITNEALDRDFRYIIKQHGGMLAKGRLLGLQFCALLEDGLYLELAGHAVSQALRIRDAFAAKGFEFICDSPTNQQFPILPDAAAEKLSKKYAYSHWTKTDETHSVVRFCTSWATKPSDVDELIGDIAAL
ncbi:MAG: aminotransferase class I/II-fold pyridoxal phosphate-dependent enzyme [Clostridiales bacterium]|nr:aminotransferase class I/II-fold pyridoxal phosphate-dependent enzyme [Clostridiales bacterium]